MYNIVFILDWESSDNTSQIGKLIKTFYSMSRTIQIPYNKWVNIHLANCEECFKRQDQRPISAI